MVDDLANGVFKFGPDGRLLVRWGGKQGNRAGEFRTTVDVAAGPSGNVYVLEAYNNTRVQKFTSGGAWMMMWGATGTGPGQFQSPSSIAVDAQGFVYVLDSDAKRVQKFRVR